MMDKISKYQPIITVSVLLLILVGPMFGPIPKYLRDTLNLDIRSTSGWLLVGFFISLSIIVSVVFRYFKKSEGKIIEIGLMNKSTWKAIIVGTIVGILWGLMGWGGILQMGPNVNLLEISLFRFYMALFGAIGAVLEDIVTRGFVMNKLKQLNVANWIQILFSSILFTLYHTLWNFSIGAFVASMIYGLILSGLFVWGKRSLKPVILAHSLALIVGEPFLTMLLVMNV